MPPPIAGLVAWSQLFRCRGTFDNYVSKLRTVCHLLQVPADSTFHPSVRVAAVALGKRQPAPRPRRGITQKLLSRLVRIARAEDAPGEAVLPCDA
eukprot:14038949-Alexandrium_andersonii.AAC.1